MEMNSLLSAGICILIDDYMNLKARRDDALSVFCWAKDCKEQKISVERILYLSI